MLAHFVEFMSPGTFVSEKTTKPIDSWSVDKALQMAADVIERHGARPFGFRFITRERGETDLDSKVTKFSGIYYLGGTVRTIEDVERDALPDENILLANMRGNRWHRIITNSNSWKWTGVLNDEDTVLDFTMPTVGDA